MRTRRRGLGLALGVIVLVSGCAPVRRPPPTSRTPTIADRIAQYGPVARSRLVPFFVAAGVPYPPARVVLLGLKQERELQVFAAAPGGDLRYIRSYAIRGASGVLGPKLREGDRQVPEGVYRIWYLNPNSVAHLSLALGYPNASDVARAAEDGRDTASLGGSIMIHGGSGSTGCLAIGDEPAEDLFVLAADVGQEHVIAVVSPVDFRRSVLPADSRAASPWVDDLYDRLRVWLDGLPLPPRPHAGCHTRTRQTGWQRK